MSPKDAALMQSPFSLQFNFRDAWGMGKANFLGETLYNITDTSMHKLKAQRMLCRIAL